MQFAAVKALLFYHSKSSKIDKEAVTNLKKIESENKRTTNDKSTILAAYFYIFIEEFKKAKETLDQVTF